MAKRTNRKNLLQTTEQNCKTNCKSKSSNYQVTGIRLKIADITQHTLVSNEEITHKENSKGVVKSYEMKANNILEEATISGYRIVSKKVMKEKNGWRTMVLLEYNLL